jgi:hypothetical protein
MFKSASMKRAGWGGCLVIVGLLAAGAIEAAGPESPWPANVPAHVPPKAGEHPRLFFRKSDIPKIKDRAATPDGKAMVQRLRFLLNGSDGETMPEQENPSRASAEGAGGFAGSCPHGKGYTLWHAAGYGMLYQLTGDKKYADLGRKSVEKAFEGVRDRDNRYAWIKPYGALRGGPSLGSIALGYDLCYDGWDDGFRKKVALEIQNYNQGMNCSIEQLTIGSRHGPHSNHWGNQIGGAAMALLAIKDDPGVDEAKVKDLMAKNAECMLRQLNEGFGDGGYFNEGRGPGQIGSDTAYTIGLLAWKTAGGKDFITPRRNASMITLICVFELVAKSGGGYHYPMRGYGGGSGYGTSAFERGERPSKGWSNAGQFCKGFGASDSAYHPAILWSFNHVVEPDAAKRTYDTVSPYPQQAVLALAHWPIGIPEKNPAEALPWRALHDAYHKYFVFRNRWKDADDILVRALWGARDGPDPILVWGFGETAEWPAKFGKAKESSLHDVKPDGSGVAKADAYAMAVDFSKASGADALVVLIGVDETKPLANSRKGQTIGNKFKTESVKAGGVTYHVLTASASGQHPALKADGDALVAGGQRVTVKDGRLVLAK